MIPVEQQNDLAHNRRQHRPQKQEQSNSDQDHPAHRCRSVRQHVNVKRGAGKRKRGSEGGGARAIAEDRGQSSRQKNHAGQ